MEPKAVLRLFLVLVCCTLAGAASDDNPSRKPNTCSVESPLDLIFLIDTSSFDAATADYKRVLGFLSIVISDLDISETTTKIGVLLSDKDSSLILPLTHDINQINQRLDNVPSGIRSVHFTDAALAANAMIFFKTRMDAKIVLVVVRSAEAVASGDETYFKRLWNDLNASYIVIGVLSAAETADTYLTKPGTFISLHNPSWLIQSANSIRNAVCEASHCFFDVLVDVMFAISTTSENYSKASNLAVQISNQLDIKPNGTYVGLANTDPDYVTQPLNMRSLVNEALTMIPEQWDVLSPFGEAVKMTQGMYNGRKNGIKVIVFITDHETFKPEEDTAQAELAKSKGYTIFSITLTPEKDEDLMRPMASKPEYNLRIGDYSPLTDFIARSEVKGTCEAETCSVADKLDLIFLVDSSIDAATDVYKKVLDLIAAVISPFDINEDATKIGVILSDNTNLILNLTSDKNLIDQRLHNVPSKSQSFHFADAGFTASNLLIDEGRLGAKRVVVAVRSAEAVGTDGEYFFNMLFTRLTAGFVVVAVPPETGKTDTNLNKPANVISLENLNSLSKSANRIRNAVCKATYCSFDVLADVMFAISVTSENYPRAGDLAIQISDTLAIKEDGTYVGLANTDPAYSSQPLWERSWVYADLRNVPRRWNFQVPLQTALNMIAFRYNGRQNGIKVIIFITDHESFRPNKDPTSAELAKSKGYTVFTATLTPKEDEDWLKSMASKPEYYLRAGDYSPLTDFIARSEKKGTCKV